MNHEFEDGRAHAMYMRPCGSDPGALLFLRRLVDGIALFIAFLRLLVLSCRRFPTPTRSRGRVALRGIGTVPEYELTKHIRL